MVKFMLSSVLTNVDLGLQLVLRAENKWFTFIHCFWCSCYCSHRKV